MCDDRRRDSKADRCAHCTAARSDSGEDPYGGDRGGRAEAAGGAH